MPPGSTNGQDAPVQPPDIRAFVERLEHAIDDADLARITEAVRADPRAAEVLEALARSHDPEVRGFVPRAAREILGRAGAPLLRQLLDDPDPDIRGMALHELETLDPALVAPYAAKLRRRIARASDADEVLATGWTLVRLRDVEAAPILETFARSREPWTADARTAQVQVLALRDAGRISERIREHDHANMGWLAYAATIIGTPDAIAAVRWCAAKGPDAKCRRDCQYVLTATGLDPAAR